MLRFLYWRDDRIPACLYLPLGSQRTAISNTDLHDHIWQQTFRPIQSSNLVHFCIPHYLCLATSRSFPGITRCKVLLMLLCFAAFRTFRWYLAIISIWPGRNSTRQIYWSYHVWTRALWHPHELTKTCVRAHAALRLALLASTDLLYDFWPRSPRMRIQL